MPIVVSRPDPAPEPVSETVSVGLTKTEKARLRAMALRLGTSMSALVRNWIEQQLR